MYCMKIGVICDDFTGTASSGVLVAKTGAKTGLFFDAKTLRSFSDLDRLDAAYVSSNSRHLSPEKAKHAVAAAAKALITDGVIFLGKKIDTTLRGGIGFEIDAILDLLGAHYTAVMVTAMPPSKRICVGGYSIINSTILTETFVGTDVMTPIHESYIPNLIRTQTTHSVALINMCNVLKGAKNIAKQLDHAHQSGNRIIIVDAISMEHIDMVAKACVSLDWPVLPVDPGPFTLCLAQRLGLLQSVVHPAAESFKPDRNKPALMIVGSANPETKKQVEKLCEDNNKIAVVSVSPADLIKDVASADREIQIVSEHVIHLIQRCNPPEAIIIETALHSAILDLSKQDDVHNYPHGKSSQLINQGLGKITDMVLQSVGKNKIAGLLLTGGDTMEQVARIIGVECIEALDNIVAQIDVGRIIGKYDGLPLIVKGGFCGYDTVYEDILDRLFLERAKADRSFFRGL
jgi:uncharacterized protein YgbK (DUF1537 family)